MAEPVTEFEALMRRVREGDAQAAQEVFERYNHHVRLVVRRALHQRLRRQYDSTDFAQSVWASFFQEPPGRYTFTSPEALISFLSRVAYNKVVTAARHRIGAAKNDVRREQPLDTSSPEETGRMPDVAGDTPTPSQEVMAEECWVQMVEGLPPSYRRALEMLRDGHSHREVAAVLGVHPKMLQRILTKLRGQVRPS
jgi:RNA polymerase sigma factor (sigma-70 family)